MLSLYEFNLLPEQQKYTYVWDKCTYIAHRMESSTQRVNLYYPPPDRDEFWIEVHYNSEYNEVAKVVGFKARRLLEPYCEWIDIKELPI